MHPPPRHAFTLIELLVVVAIIVALLAILLPSMGRAVAVTQQAVCASNLRQMMTGWLSYSADYQRQNVPSWHVNGGWQSGWSTGYGWHQTLEDYATDNNDILRCPVTEGAATYGPGDFSKGWGDQGPVYIGGGDPDHQVGYMFNNWLEPNIYNIGDTDKHIPTLTAVRNAATTPALLDGVWESMGWPLETDTHTGVFNAPFDYTTNHNWSPYMRRACIDRHFAGVNVGFLDGHSERVAIEGDDNLWQLNWHAQWNPLLSAY